MMNGLLRWYGFAIRASKKNGSQTRASGVELIKDFGFDEKV